MTDRTRHPVPAGSRRLGADDLTADELRLRTLLSVSTGDARERLTGVTARHRTERDRLDAEIATGMVRPGLPPGTITAGLLSFLVLAAGFAMATTAGSDTIDDYLFAPWSAVSGVLVAAAASWFLIVEFVRLPFAGTRSRAYGRALFVALGCFALIGLIVLALRIARGDGDSTGTAQGLALQTVGIVLHGLGAALFVAGFVAAGRNRPEVAVLAQRASATAVVDAIARVDRLLRSDLDRQLARADTAEIDFAAASGTIRSRLVNGEFPADWAADALRGLG